MLRNVLTCTTALRSGPHRGLQLDAANMGHLVQAVILRVRSDPPIRGPLRGAAQKGIRGAGKDLTWIMHCGWYRPRWIGCDHCHGTGLEPYVTALTLPSGGHLRDLLRVTHSV